MKKPAGRKPSPALIVAAVALVVALTGTAVGGVALNRLSSKEKHQVTRIAKRQANKRINERAPRLSVASAVDAETLEGQPPAAFAAASSELYREIGSSGEPDFQNGWANAGGTFSTAAFFKDSLGVVHLKGTLMIAASSGTIAFTLPPDYRPSQDMFMPGANSANPPLGPASLTIKIDGSVKPYCSGAGTCVIGIDGLTFRR